MSYTPQASERPYQHLVRDEQIRIAFSQTMKGVVGGGLGAVLLVWAFWPVADATQLVTWLALLAAIALLRVGYYAAFLRRDERTSTAVWERRFVIGTALHASAWGAAWWVLLPVHNDPSYTLVAAIWVTALSAASFSAYIVHLPSMLAFFVPVVVPGILRIYTIGGHLETAIALGLCLYCGVVLSSMLPVHRAMVSSIRLNFENAHEITERKRAEAKLREISIRDGLTGLATRGHFDEELAREIHRAQRDQTPLSLLLIDIDCFKALNDTRGHIEGDACLRQVASLINSMAKRPGDLAARYGGEEFVVILPNTDATQAHQLALSMRAGVEALGLENTATTVENCNVITVCIGISTITPVRSATAEDLIAPADEALYRAKSAGRNRVESDQVKS